MGVDGGDEEERDEDEGEARLVVELVVRQLRREAADEEYGSEDVEPRVDVLPPVAPRAGAVGSDLAGRRELHHGLLLLLLL